MSVMRELQNGKTKRYSNKFGGYGGASFVEVYGKVKRSRNLLLSQLRTELLEFRESAVCITDNSHDRRVIEKEITAVETIIAKLDLGPGEYSVEVDPSGDVHIRLGANIDSFATMLIVRDGQIVCACSDEVEEPEQPEDPYSAYYDLLRLEEFEVDSRF